MNYYEVMGLTIEATDEDIRKAYRSLARLYHPDRNPGDKDAEEKFKQISAANNILSDPVKRSQYNLRIPIPPKPTTKQPYKTKEDFERERTEKDRQDQKKNTDKELNEVDCSYFGGGGTGRNVLVQLKLTDKEKKTGCKKIVKIKKRDLCNRCIGDGKAPKPCPKCSLRRSISKSIWCEYCSNDGYIQAQCTVCNGEGVHNYYISDIQVNISAGVQPGHAILVLGEGEAAPNKAPGNVRVVIV